MHICPLIACKFNGAVVGAEACCLGLYCVWRILGQPKRIKPQLAMQTMIHTRSLKIRMWPLTSVVACLGMRLSAITLFLPPIAVLVSDYGLWSVQRFTVYTYERIPPTLTPSPQTIGNRMIGSVLVTVPDPADRSAC